MNDIDSIQYISLKDASKLCSYSQDYLSLRARQGKLKAVKIGRNWMTTKEWVDKYIIKVPDQIQYVSLKDASKLCSYSQDYLSLRARQGKLKAVKIDRNWVTTEEWLSKYIIKAQDVVNIRKVKDNVWGYEVKNIAEKYIGNSMDRVLASYDKFVLKVKEIKKPKISIKPKFAISAVLISLLIISSLLVFNPQAWASMADFAHKSIDKVVDSGRKSAEFVFEQGQNIVLLAQDTKKSAGNLFDSIIIESPKLIEESTQSIQEASSNVSSSIQNKLVNLSKKTSNKIQSVPKTTTNLVKGFYKNIDKFGIVISNLPEEIFEFANNASNKNEELKLAIKYNTKKISGQIIKIPSKIEKLSNKAIYAFIDINQKNENAKILFSRKIKNSKEFLSDTPHIVSLEINKIAHNLSDTYSNISNILSDTPQKLSDMSGDIDRELVYAYQKIGSYSNNFDRNIGNFTKNSVKNLSSIIKQTPKDISAGFFNIISDVSNNIKSKLGDTYIKIAEFVIPGYSFYDQENYLIYKTKQETPIIQEITKQVQQITPKTVTEKRIITITETNKVIETIASADLDQINQDIQNLSQRITSLGNQIGSKIDYTTPSYSPVSIPSSGLQVSGHALLSSLNVSGSGAFSGSLGVAGNASFGNTKDQTTVFDVYSDATFHNGASFNSGLSATSLSSTGTLTAATTTLSQLTINNDLLVSGNASTTGSHYIGNDLTVMNGNLGIGTTSPSTTLSITGHGYFTGGLGVGVVNTTANSFQVGQCVTGDTLLRRRRRRKKKDGTYEYYFEDVRIDQIKPGDEILTLDDKTGKLKVSKVKKLMYMGKKPIVEITTSMGRKIRTTANHPYFAKVNQPKIKKPKLGIFYDDANMFYAQRKAGWRVDLRKLKKSLSRQFDVSAFDYYIATPEKQDKAFKKTANFINKIKAHVQIVTKLIKYIKIDVGLKKKADMDVEIALGVVRRIKDLDAVMIVSGDSDLLPLKKYVLEKGKKIIYAGFKQNIAWELRKYSKYFYLDNYKNELNNSQKGHKKTTSKPKLGVALLSLLYASAPSLSSGGMWRKVSQLKKGQEIAILDDHGKSVWDTIKTMRKLPVEDVYDIEVEGTHNFIGNNIVAHNTAFKVTSDGNVGIGTTTPDSKLTVIGKIHASSTSEQLRLTYDLESSKYASFTIDSNGDLNIDLATGNSTTTISDNLSVLGYLNVEGNATTTGSQYIKKDLTVDGQ
ncbi:NYN domain-containing protein, partial [Patescibacteria group bacterium]|nr:NYN domain-containing protein [Patescibacteria group bacterium]